MSASWQLRFERRRGVRMSYWHSWLRHLTGRLLSKWSRLPTCPTTKARLGLEILEDRLTPATLSIDGAGNAVFTGISGNDSVTISRNSENLYRIQVVGDTITLTGAGTAAW